jgi:putative acetyltransferase
VAYVLRPIRPEDDAAVAGIIRRVMGEFGASGPGFAIHDPEVDAMSAAYPAPRAIYFVLDQQGAVLGGGGIGPLAGGDPIVCELRKMYFLPEARGLGAGKALLARCIDEARARGYRRVYLETLTGMIAAQRAYDRFGFRRLSAPLGATGHFGCDRWYALDLAREGGPR